MLRFSLKRILGLVPTAFFVTFLTFSLLKAAPGDPALMLLQQRETIADEASIAEVRKELGLHQPFVIQYLSWLKRVLQGGLGTSYYTPLRVSKEIRRAFPVTLALALWAFLVSLGVTAVLGLLSARQGSIGDFISKIGAVLGSAIPSFWLGLLLIFVFAVKFGVLPAVAMKTAKSYALPIATLAFGPALFNARLFGSTLQETNDGEYVLFARSKGLTEWQILLLHRLKPSLTPMISSLGVTVGMLLGGTVLVENIFACPGMGTMAVQAIFNRDFPMVMGYALVMSAVYTVVNLSADILCAWFDPRVRMDEP